VTSRALAETLRRLYPVVLARIVRTSRDMPDAEDAVQDALARAVELWPKQGWPDNAEAWLMAVAKNRFLDGVRRRRRQREHADTLADLARVAPWSLDRLRAPSTDGWDDDMLALIVTCCDPALSRHEAVALTLASIVGLSPGELGRLFVASPTTMQQRLTRARQRLKALPRGYSKASTQDLRPRLSVVLMVLRAIFDEGYWSTGSQALRPELCELAVALTRSLCELVDDRDGRALLGTMLLLDARRPARLQSDGRAVALSEQDRRRWRADDLAEGLTLVRSAASEGQPSTLVLEAAIAALHAEAPTAADTDWAQIATLYALLERRAPSPIVRVNRAVAVAEHEGPAAALALLDDGVASALASRPYPYLPLLRGRLLAELGYDAEAEAELRRAHTLANNPEEARQLGEHLSRHRLEREQTT
jgi:RNA polymerase sigma-70 factor, ECF subfamily